MARKKKKEEKVQNNDEMNKQQEEVKESPDGAELKDISDAEMAEELIKLTRDLNTSYSKIEELEKEKQELNDKLLRRAAEFENYKRRTENEIQKMLKYASEPIVISILDIFADFERSVVHLEEDTYESVKKGLELVYGKFRKMLEKEQIKKIEAKGKPFDFELHEALMQQPSADVPANTVLQEVEPGYIFKDKVIKHAKVIVSQPKD